MNTDTDTTRAPRPSPSRAMTSKARVGRPSKRTEAHVREVITLIASGTPVKQAARHVGVDPVTLWRWRQRDPELDKAVYAARAAFLQRQVERIDEAATGDWKAAAWLLERSEPSSFGRRVEVAVEAQAMPVLDPLTGRVVGGPQDDNEADDDSDWTAEST